MNRDLCWSVALIHGVFIIPLSLWSLRVLLLCCYHGNHRPGGGAGPIRCGHLRKVLAFCVSRRTSRGSPWTWDRERERDGCNASRNVMLSCINIHPFDLFHFIMPQPGTEIDVMGICIMDLHTTPHNFTLGWKHAIFWFYQKRPKECNSCNYVMKVFTLQISSVQPAVMRSENLLKGKCSACK